MQNDTLPFSLLCCTDCSLTFCVINNGISYLTQVYIWTLAAEIKLPQTIIHQPYIVPFEYTVNTMKIKDVMNKTGHWIWAWLNGIVLEYNSNYTSQMSEDITHRQKDKAHASRQTLIHRAQSGVNLGFFTSLKQGWQFTHQFSDQLYQSMRGN